MRASRDALVRTLSPDLLCAGCGWRARRPSQLEVDHIDGRMYVLRTLARWTRVRRFWRELEDGVRLRALCRSCNGSDGARRRYPGLVRQ